MATVDTAEPLGAAVEGELPGGAATGAVGGAGIAADTAATGFQVDLRNFHGPFDLLLQLITAKKLEVTEVALGEVTDEFIAYTRRLNAGGNLDEVTSFLVVAATLLDLKTARLLPQADVDDEDDLALLETRDLLFARLLQYRAFRAIAQTFSEWEARALVRYPRAVSLEPRYLDLLPEVELGVSPKQFAEIAAAAFRPAPVPEVGVDHIHAHAISVPVHARAVLSQLERAGVGSWLSFAAVTRECTASIEVIARFLALLELYRAGALAIRQDGPLEPLDIAWTGESVDASVFGRDDWEADADAQK